MDGEEFIRYLMERVYRDGHSSVTCTSYYRSIPVVVHIALARLNVVLAAIVHDIPTTMVTEEHLETVKQRLERLECQK